MSENENDVQTSPKLKVEVRLTVIIDGVEQDPVIIKEFMERTLVSDLLEELEIGRQTEDEF